MSPRVARIAAALRGSAGIELGSVAQAIVPGFYAWLATVAPTAWARGAPLVAKVAALVGLVLLGASAFAEARSPKWARATSVWGLTLTSCLVWIAAPGGILNPGGNAPALLAPTRLDTARAISGMVGWALFAYASAAPAVVKTPPPTIPSTRDTVTGDLKPRAAVPRGDILFVVGGTALALGLQLVGWRAVSPERALLIRLVALAGGVALIGAATDIALARHKARSFVPPKYRVRASLPWLIALAFLAMGGFLFWLRT